MKKRGLKLNTFNLIIGLVGGIVTIVASIGGSYVTTQVVLARHDERIKTLETEQEDTNKKVDKYLEILTKIDKNVAVKFPEAPIVLIITRSHSLGHYELLYSEFQGISL